MSFGLTLTTRRIKLRAASAGNILRKWIVVLRKWIVGGLPEHSLRWQQMPLTARAASEPTNKEK